MYKRKKLVLKKPFSIVYPSDKNGTFIVSNTSNSGVTGLDVSPYKEQTLYFDQYSGKKLGMIKYDDYGIIAKWFTWGIPLHEGHLFGILNKIINLFVCIALLVAIGMGFVSWIKRTKNTAVKVPHRVKKTSIYITHNMFNCIRIINAIIWIITYPCIYN